MQCFIIMPCCAIVLSNPQFFKFTSAPCIVCTVTDRDPSGTQNGIDLFLIFVLNWCGSVVLQAF